MIFLVILLNDTDFIWFLLQYEVSLCHFIHLGNLWAPPTSRHYARMWLDRQVIPLIEATFQWRRHGKISELLMLMRAAVMKNRVG